MIVARLLSVLLFLALSVNSYKILIYSPKIGHSHVTFLGTIADLLIEAGNDVTVLAPEVQPRVRTNGTKLAKVITVPVDKEIQKFFDFDKTINNFWTLDSQSPLSQIHLFVDSKKYSEMLCEDFQAKEDLLQWVKNEKFDIAISEVFDTCLIGTYKALGIRAHILASATILMETASYAAGVPFPPSTIPSSFSGLTDRMNFVERIKNLVGIGLTQWFLGGMIDVHQSVIDKKYGEGQTNIWEEIGDCSMIITNTDPLLDFPRPTLDKVINIGGVSVPKPKPLDAQWEEILSRREKTVLMSFGSIAQSSEMPENMKKTVLQVFKQFPDVTFIWKYEKPEENIAKDVPNVVLSKWIPQNDLLNHRNLSVFITHSGMNSVLEAANGGVPLLSIPLFADQMRNAKMIVRAEIGEEGGNSLLLDSSAFAQKLRSVLYNEKYAKTAQRLAEMMRNRPIPLKEQLVRNVEFVARFGRLPNMKPTSMELGFVQYFLLDIVAVAVLVTLLFLISIFLVSFHLVRLLYCKMSRKTKVE